MDFHSDYVAFGDTSLIPSISLGEEREFKFREKISGNVFGTKLANGSLIIMGKHLGKTVQIVPPISVL